MIPSIRRKFNAEFSEEKYRSFLSALNKPHPGFISFRVAETPVFLPRSFKDKLVDACENIVDVILRPNFKQLTEESIPVHLRVPHEDSHCELMCLDFAVCLDTDGQLCPQLIEMQGFPTMFFFQALLASGYRQSYQIPEGFDNYFNGYDDQSYKALLKRMILGGHNPEHVILLEVRPEEQKTKIDFYLTEGYTGVRPVCISELVQDGRKLYYTRNGEKTEVKRIYNRMISDDFELQKNHLMGFIDITQALDVEWLPHPNWFYRISKYTLPFLRSPYVPETCFLHEVKNLPDDLENYVLKPLFSFAGQGVIIDIRETDVAAIAHPEQWILQKKVDYEPIVKTPTGMGKCELRMMYFWEKGAGRPVLVNNLARISKGKMVGVRYNQDLDWVGASIGFFES